MKLSNGLETHEVDVLDGETGAVITQDFIGSGWVWDDETDTLTCEGMNFRYLKEALLDLKYNRGDFFNEGWKSPDEIVVYWDEEYLEDN